MGELKDLKIKELKKVRKEGEEKGRIVGEKEGRTGRMNPSSEVNIVRCGREGAEHG